MSLLAPGGVIGVLGGGQLGRMLAMAAAQLGYKVCVFAPENDAPAADVSSHFIRADFRDVEALNRFAAEVDVITYEFENVPVDCAAYLADLKPVWPDPVSLGIAQDRLQEKVFAQKQGLETAPYHPVASLDDARAGFANLGGPCLLKTRRLGYDGKGQAQIDTAANLAQAWSEIGQTPSLLEARMAFEREVSVLVARGRDGVSRCYGPVENTHANGILDKSVAPASLTPSTTEAALSAAIKLADALNYVGVLGVELFVMADGRVLFNEMAPRVHNSGHWTIEGARTSQFENHVRAICGLPLGDTSLLGRVEMQNLIGEDVERWRVFLADPAARLHLYGKSEARAGRKMGHVTWVRPF
jgi:5-(carboxyamino)imidazole ribonucleotide synthase